MEELSPSLFESPESVPDRDISISSRVHRRSMSDGVRSVSPYSHPCVLRTGGKSLVVTTDEQVVTNKNDMSRAFTMDCAICAGPLKDPAVGGGCAHHFCYECYDEWCTRKSNCPTCRAPVWCLTRDTELAELIDPDALSSPSSPSQRSPGSVTSDVPEDHVMSFIIAAPPGITLSNDGKLRSERIQLWSCHCR